MKPIPYTLTSESVTVVVDGTPHTFQKETPNYRDLKKAIFNEDWASIPKFLTVAASIEQWAKGDFTVRGDTVAYKGVALPQSLNKRIMATAGKGESPTPLFRFWERLQKNPSWRSVQQLWAFLDHDGIPLDEEGFILAYKAVKSNFTDCHTGKIDNHPGQKHSMERNLVSDDPEVACHFGFHVGALAYASTFGGNGSKIIICKIDPADVVCIPKDSNAQKMRVCAYEVIGHHAGGLMPSTTFKEDLEEEDPDTDLEEEDTEGGDIPGTGDDSNEDDDDFNNDDDDEGEAPVRQVKKGKAAPKSKAKKVAPKAQDTSKVTTSVDSTKLFAEMDKEDGDALMNRDLASLRRYAAVHVKIVGASKIPGGKPSLVDRIVTVRG